MARRRRRRAKAQRKTKSGLGKWFLRGGVVLLLVAVVGVVYGYQTVRGYLRSDDFRVMLQEESGYLLEGEVEIDPVRWDGWKAKTEEFRFQDTAAVQVLRAEGVEADVDISAVWNDEYHVSHVGVSHLEVAIDTTRPRGAAPPKPEKEELFWDRYLPENYRVSRVDIAELIGDLKTADGDWSWEEMSAVVTPGKGKGVYDFEVTGGAVNTPLDVLKKAKLVKASGRYADQQVFLLGAEVGVLERGRLSMDGDYSLADKSWKARGQLENADCKEVVATDWKKSLLGVIATDFEMSSRPGRESVLSGQLRIDEGVLTALPVLDRIAAYADTARFRRLALSEAELEFEKSGNVLKLSGIRLASEGLVQLEGEMEIAGNVIRRGDFRLGITPGTLARIPGAETKVFHRGKRGLLWTPLKVSGTLDAPQEDLSDRLIAAARERMFEIVPETGMMVLKFGGEVVGDSVKKIIGDRPVVNGVLKTSADTVDKAVETGGGIVRDGVDTLFNVLGGRKKKEE